MREVINQKRLRTWETTGGICCFLAGLLAPLLGIFLTMIGWIVGSAAHPWMHAVSTALFIVAVPLILVAGFFLDWAEKRQKKSPSDPKQAQGCAAALAEITEPGGHPTVA